MLGRNKILSKTLVRHSITLIKVDYHKLKTKHVAIMLFDITKAPIFISPPHYQD